MTAGVEIIGRQSSHYTRMTRIFAEECGLEVQLSPIFDLMSGDAGTYGGNPALKLPVLKLDGEAIYGSVNICQALVRAGGDRLRVVWPWEANTALLMNAHEVLAHAMAAEVEMVVHELVEKRAADTASKKRRQSLVNSLVWLDAHLDDVLDGLGERDLSLFEVGLYCLIAHIPFRNPMDLSGTPRLLAFEAEFGARPSARATPYQFDQPQGQQ
jgi:glutathione S-transferase